MNAKLYLGDCLEVMKEIPNGSVDMVLADLPYGTTACKWDTVIPLAPLWEQYLRVSRPSAAFVLFAQQPFTSSLVMSAPDMLREALVWEKHKPANFACGKYMHLKYHEDILVFSRERPTYNPQRQPRESGRVKQMQAGKSQHWRTTGETAFQTKYAGDSWGRYDGDTKLPGTVLRFPAVGSNSREKVPHPTQKPVALLEYLIRTYSSEGATVLDNTMGSGSTGVACVSLGRDFIGIEKDQKYFEIAQKRIFNSFPPFVKQVQTPEEGGK